MKIRKAVIPAAGLGTRFLPATKSIPKEMVPIADKPIIQYMVEEAAQSGIEQVIVVTARGKDAMANHFDASPELETALEHKGKLDILEKVKAPQELCEIVCVRQKNPMGLGHAIGCAERLVGDEPFVVLLPDDMIDNPRYPACRQMMDVFEEHGKNVVALMQVPERQYPLYGMVEYDRVSDKVVKVKRSVEKPSIEESPSNLGIVARYLFKPDIFEAIKHTTPGKGAEIQITDAINTRAQQGEVMGLVFEGERFDAGDRLGFLEATLHYALKHPELGEEVKTMLNNLDADEA